MWLIIAITAYFINAGVYVADKFLLSKKFHSSIVYAFYVGIWSIFNIFLLILDPWLPNLQQLGLNLIAGLIFLATLVFWYKALHQSEASRVVPIVGALVPVFSFLLSFIFLGESLSERQFLAFAVLINGGILISVKKTRFYATDELINRFKNVFGNLLGSIHAKYRPTRRLLINSLISAFFFAVYYVLIKHIYSTQPFIGSFVWSRMGSFLGVIIILAVPNWRALIFKSRKNNKAPKNMIFFIGARILAAIAFIMLNWAISLGNVSLINALQGTQYIFLFLLIILLSAKFPKILNEKLGAGVFIQKIIGMVLVSLGLYMLII